MGQHCPNVDFVAVVVDRSNQAVFVAADIEYRQALHVIGTRKGRFECIEILENSFLYYARQRSRLILWDFAFL